MKILLLEDDLILNEILEEHLIKQKHQITTTFSSNEAIKELYSETFDLLLLDVNVPDLNGFELLKELRDNNILTPTIFITSLNMVEDMQKGFDSGCDDYIKKPFELKELDIRINNIKRLFNIDIKIIKIDENSNRIIFDCKHLGSEIDSKIKFGIKREKLKSELNNDESFNKAFLYLFYNFKYTDEKKFSFCQKDNQTKKFSILEYIEKYKC